MLTVEQAVKALAGLRDELAEPPIAVVTMSAIAWWPARDEDYRLMGLMGSAASIGLGIALGRPDRQVWVIDGDGSALMQLGVVTAVADSRPANLVHLVIDNGIYAISGGQPTPGSRDWGAMFQAAGYASGTNVTTEAELGEALAAGPGPVGIGVRCESVRPDYPPGAFSVRPAEEARRVRAALGGGS